MNWRFWMHRHEVEIVDVQHVSMGTPSLMGPPGPQQAHTIVLTRCKGCRTVGSSVMVGTWSIEQVRDGKSMSRAIEDLTATRGGKP